MFAPEPTARPVSRQDRELHFEFTGPPVLNRAAARALLNILQNHHGEVDVDQQPSAMSPADQPRYEQGE